MPLNLGVLHPLDVERAAEDAHRGGSVSIASAEGFVRQVLGWREYVWQLYWRFGRGLPAAQRAARPDAAAGVVAVAGRRRGDRSRTARAVASLDRLADLDAVLEEESARELFLTVSRASRHAGLGERARKGRTAVSLL